MPGFRPNLLSVATVAIVLLLGAAAQAQFVPYGLGPLGEAWAYGSIGAYDMAVTRQMHERQRAAAQNLTASREARIRGDVRNALLNEAQVRTQVDLGEDQAARNWWLAQQSRQMATQATMPTATPLATSVPPPSPGLIAWPALLRRPVFMVSRMAIESPFARYTAGGEAVTRQEYETIVQTARGMQQTLEGLANQAVASEYLAAQQFLDRLIEESRGRIAALAEIAPAAAPTQAPVGPAPPVRAP